MVPLRSMVTSEILTGHGLFDIVQRYTLFPTEILVTELLGELGMVNVPPPLTTVQLPEPIAGAFAFIVVKSVHIF